MFRSCGAGRAGRHHRRRYSRAVLAAKRAGGNQVAVSDDISLKRLFRNDIKLHLQGEIDSQALLLHYLPEVDLRSGAIVAAEALVRWRHPTRGLLLPDSFIGIAESMDLAGELGRWVLRNACAEFSRWRSRGVGQIAVLRSMCRLCNWRPGFGAEPSQSRPCQVCLAPTTGYRKGVWPARWLMSSRRRPPS